MSYVLLTKNKNISVPINQAQKLWAQKEFNTELPLVMVFTGWTTSVKDPENTALNLLWSAYRCRGNVNFVVSFCVLVSFFILYAFFIQAFDVV